MGLLKKNNRSRSVVGLDLDPGHIAAAEVHVNGSLSVTRGVVSPLRPGILRDGEIGDAQALAEALKQMWSEHKLPSRVRLGLANQRIVVRSLDLPPLTDEKAIAAAVRHEAPDHIPMPMDEAVIDYQPIGMVETGAGPRMRVVVVAVRREMVERYAEALQSAGLQLEGIDLAAFGLVRALAGGAAADDGVLYVNVAGLVNVAVARGSHCLFTRAAAGGFDQMVQTLANRRSLTAEHSAQWLVHVGLATPLSDVEGDEELITGAREVLEEGVHQLADTVRNSLNFYRMQENAESVDRVVITGPAVSVPGFVERLGTALGMPAEPGMVAHDAGVADASRLAIAAGLAVDGA